LVGKFDFWLGCKMNQDTTRRDVVKKITIVVGGVATLIELPARWTKPVVESIIAPAHAALSATDHHHHDCCTDDDNDHNYGGSAATTTARVASRRAGLR
jgi:hypothetical protein